LNLAQFLLGLIKQMANNDFESVPFVCFSHHLKNYFVIYCLSVVYQGRIISLFLVLRTEDEITCRRWWGKS